MKKIFLLILVGIIGGCVSVTKHPTNIRKSFVQIRKTVEINICGEIGDSGISECKKLMNMDNSGSGSVVWNEYSSKRFPRTLVLTANHLCETPEYKLDDFDRGVFNHVYSVLGFKEPVEVITTSSMVVVDSFGYSYGVKQFPWVRNVSADTCIIETSMNAPSLNIGTSVEFGDKVINIAAPKGIYHTSSSGGGIFYTEGIYNGEFLTSNSDDDRRLFSMYNLSAAPGSSGSPVLNKNGEIIGMIHSIDSRYCNIITNQCNSPISYSATLNQIKDTILEALNAIKRGESIVFDYKMINQ